MTGGSWPVLSALDARVLRATDARYERSPEKVGELAGCVADVALSALRRLRVVYLVEDDGGRPQRWLRPPRGCRAGARAGRCDPVRACGAHQRREADGRRGGVRGGGQGARKTEVTVPGQLALVIETETVVPAAVWETLPPEHQLQVAVRLARLLARLVEAARDE